MSEFDEFVKGLPGGFDELMGSIMGSISPLQRAAMTVATLLSGTEAQVVKAKLEELEAGTVLERQRSLVVARAYADGKINGKNEGHRNAQIGALLAGDNEYMQLEHHTLEAKEEYESMKVAANFVSNVFKVTMAAIREEEYRAKSQ